MICYQKIRKVRTNNLERFYSLYINVSITSPNLWTQHRVVLLQGTIDQQPTPQKTKIQQTEQTENMSHENSVDILTLK